MNPAAGNNTLPVFNPVLKRLLFSALFLFFLLLINSIYLGTVTLLEYFSGQSYQDPFYLMMFFAHLLAGLLLTLLFFLFVAGHVFRAVKHTNTKAIRAGYLLLTSALLLFISGLILSRFDFFEVNSQLLRTIAYWLHVLTPAVLILFFILHRRAKSDYRFNHAKGLRWAAISLILSATTLVAYITTKPGEMTYELHYLPALTRTPGNIIEPEHLMTDDECAECHVDIAHSAARSMHRFSSFNNPAYRFSVAEARQNILQRDGNVHAARFCAACHDLVPLLSGRFDDPHYDMDSDPTAQAGLTCMSCHAITRINSTRGNADFSIEDPPRYPFAFSNNPWLKWVNHQLIKSKPAFHKNKLLKPLHLSAEFCSTCHKNHLPVALNHYRWLRGQDHYSSFLFSGVSGHRVDSFYYPDEAVERCSQCHMPLEASEDPAAQSFNHSDRRSVHSHRFAAANTGVAQMMGLKETLAAQQNMLKDSVRIDIFALRGGGDINGKLLAPLRPGLPQLEPGREYLLEIVVRNLKPGHHLTQGTSDSNQLWLEIKVQDNAGLIAHSGHMQADGMVDPWAYFVNAYVLDRQGKRIDRRNAADIFVSLYNHQIPPGAASVVHYRLKVPENADGPLNISAQLNYRKFDTTFLRYIKDDPLSNNPLPVTILGQDQVSLPLRASHDMDMDMAMTATVQTPIWERWNDYGIGLLRQGEDSGNAKGGLRQAEAVFKQVAAIRPEQGYLNLARVYFQEGRLDEASHVLEKAQQANALPWTVDWFAALIERENGQLDFAIQRLNKIIASDYSEAELRGFDFAYDIRVLNNLGRIYLEKSRYERRDKIKKQDYLSQAEYWFKRVLQIDVEDLSAHYNLALVYAAAGQPGLAATHRELHEMYRPDDNAVAQAVSLHRRQNAAADHAASAIAIYPLHPVAETANIDTHVSASTHE